MDCRVAYMRIVGWILGMGLVAAGCGAESTDTLHSFGDGKGTAGATAGSGAAGSSGGSMASLPPSSPPPPVNHGGSSGSGGSDDDDDDEPCAASSVEAKRIEREVEYEVIDEIVTSKPVALYIVVDRSGSMRGRRWDSAIAALRSFVDDPRSSGIDVALTYFPHNDFNWLDALFGIILGGIQPPPCDSTDYIVPKVPLGRLPDHAAAINRSLTSERPNGAGTPIEPALHGMTEYCINFERANPDQKCVGVFVSDGAPSGCNHDRDALGSIVEAAYRDHGIRTFSIGIDGADYRLMNDLGRLGGTDCDPNGPNYACDAGLGEGLADALELIRETVTETTTRIETRIEVEVETLECEFDVPEPPPGESFDKNQVNLLFSEPGASEIRMGRVDGEAACAGVTADAWHYDDLEAPSRILVCPNTCDRIQASEQGRMDIQLGCKTEIVVQ